MIKQTYRIPLRIELNTFQRLESIAKKHCASRTSVISNALWRLCHDLQTERLKFTSVLIDRAFSNSMSRTIVQTRLPIDIIDYLRMNGLNITSCVHYALDNYIFKDHGTSATTD